MSVRTQASVSSLTKYAMARSPGVDLYNGSTSRDFCNSFWGEGDAGVNVLFARMRGATRTTDNLKNFWKERASIEEEYAKKLLQLAQNSMGKDEMAELRNALDTLQLETEKLANTHLQLSIQIRTEMEEPTAALLAKQVELRRTIQTSVEKKYKSKLSSETHVTKAREKYQVDCVRIANYTAQLENAPQSPDAERIKVKLRNAKQTVGANEKDYKAFAGALAEMIPVWEADWKTYCDLCQDLEEERLDFMKDNLWAYANAVSTVCVADDESCETIRTVLDQLETDRDLENFVHEYGTGSSIPNPPEFVPYGATSGGSIIVDGTSSTTSLPNNAAAAAPALSVHPAGFTRKTRRVPHGQAAAVAPPYNSTGSGSGTSPPLPPQQASQRDNTSSIGRAHRTPSPTRSTTVSSPPRSTSNGNSNSNNNIPSPPPPSSPPQSQSHHHQHSQSQSQSQSQQSQHQHHHQGSQGYQQQPGMRNAANGTGYGGDSETRTQEGVGGGGGARGDVQNKRTTLPPQPTPYEVAAPIPPVPAPTAGGGGRGGERAGNKILFYVEAMYDYTATIEEEFNFQAGDIIAVTDIPDDGWWSGELLDEARREEGRHVFPSNFVRLF